MNEKDVVETIYGKRHKYQIVKDSGGLLTSTKFNIYRDGSYYKGTFSTLSAAVERAKREG